MKYLNLKNVFGFIEAYILVLSACIIFVSFCFLFVSFLLWDFNINNYIATLRVCCGFSFFVALLMFGK